MSIMYLVFHYGSSDCARGLYQGVLSVAVSIVRAIVG